MSLLRKTLKLRSGLEIPQIGFGTYEIKGTDYTDAVKNALKVGYRHIDTADLYKCEKTLLVGISDYNRSDLFISTKFLPGKQGFDGMYSNVQKSLSLLGFDYFDVVLMHWPGVTGLRQNDPKNADLRLENWKALETLKAEGKIKSIGVSNFLIKHLSPLLAHAEIKPDLNQFEFHPFCQDDDLVKYCKDNEIQVEAYSPLARGGKILLENETINFIANEKAATPAQVALRWAIQKDLVVLPKSVRPERMKENSDLDFFSLTDSEMTAIDGLNQDHHTCWNPTTIF